MKTINYKGKGEHSVRELELIIEQQAEELHLLKSGQEQLRIHDVVWQSELLVCDVCNAPVLLNKAENYIICSQCGYHKNAN